MKNIRIFLLLLLLCSFASCHQGLKYPKNLPEVARVDSIDGDGITTKMYSDKEGRTFRIATFNLQGDLCTMPQTGVAETIILYDDNSRKFLYFDAKKQPVENSVVGYACSIEKFDSNKNLIEESYYDAQNKLTPIKINDDEKPYAITRYERDSNGNITKMTYLDEKEKVIVPVIVYAYNKNQVQIKTSYLDEKGAPMLNKYGYSTFEYIVDDNGAVSEYSYRGVKGELVMVQSQDFYYVNSEGNDDNPPHAMGKFIYPAEDSKDQYTRVRLFDAQNKFIKEVISCNDEEGDEEDENYLDVSKDTFSEAITMKKVSDFLIKARLKIKPDGSPFEILQGWNFFTYSLNNNYADGYQWSFEEKDWNKASDGSILSEDDARAIYDQSARYSYYVATYLYANLSELPTIFKVVKPLIKQVISKDLYESSGCQLLVNTALQAYEDIHDRGYDYTIRKIDDVMKISTTDKAYYQTSNLYNPLTKIVSLTIDDLNCDLSDEDKKAVIVWSYSFWLRRSNDNNSDVAQNILMQIEEMYK